MATMRNMTDAPMAAQPGENSQAVRDRWAGEVNNGSMANSGWNEPWAPSDTRFGPPSGQPGLQMGGGNRMPGGQGMSNGQRMSGELNMQNNLPIEIIESPTTVNEAYLGSLKANLVRNKGNYIVATFLVGTQNLVSWEGILYEVGNDYLTIYQPGRDRYIVIDMYSLRYMEFYDTQRREMCDQLLRERNQMQNQF